MVRPRNFDPPQCVLCLSGIIVIYFAICSPTGSGQYVLVFPYSSIGGGASSNWSSRGPGHPLPPLAPPSALAVRVASAVTEVQDWWRDQLASLDDSDDDWSFKPRNYLPSCIYKAPHDPVNTRHPAWSLETNDKFFSRASVPNQCLFKGHRIKFL